MQQSLRSQMSIMLTCSHMRLLSIKQKRTGNWDCNELSMRKLISHAGTAALRDCLELGQCLQSRQCVSSPTVIRIKHPLAHAHPHRNSAMVLSIIIIAPLLAICDLINLHAQTIDDAFLADCLAAFHQCVEIIHTPEHGSHFPSFDQLLVTYCFW